MNHTDAILIFQDNTAPVCTESLKPLLSNGASLIVIRNSSQKLTKEELLSHHHLNDFDLKEIPEIQLRDIILIQAKNHPSIDFHLAYLWNSEISTYDIDAVRIPWHKLGGPTDKRNNPLGKNPTNVWRFDEDRPNPQNMSLFSPAVTEENTVIEYSSFGFGTNALIRLIKAHSADKGTIFLHAPTEDFALFEKTIQAQNRLSQKLLITKDKQRSPLSTKANFQVETITTQQNSVTPRTWLKGEAKAQFWLGDCRQNIPLLPKNSVTHVITSPPYNINYTPFNVDTKDHAGNTQNPNREAYEDDLSDEEYRQLLGSTFKAIDQVASPKMLNVFVNIKNDYQDGHCVPPFYLLELIPQRWKLLNILVWEYDISFDPGTKKYKPQYEWILYFGYGKQPKQKYFERWYFSIQKGNSKERKGLKHPAVFPYVFVEKALRHSKAKPETSFVIDPFVGSGTVLKKCLMSYINCAGFEKNQTFVADIQLQMHFFKELEI